jgi:hypothetical protein
MAAQSKLTPAKKRKLTIAAKAQKEVEENIVFRNQCRKFAHSPSLLLSRPFTIHRGLGWATSQEGHQEECGYVFLSSRGQFFN